MIKKLQHIFALSEKGARDLVKAVIWCFVCNLALMFPVGAVLFTVQHLLAHNSATASWPWAAAVPWTGSGSMWALPWWC